VANLPGVAEVRQRGLMVGIELSECSPAERLGHRVALAARSDGAVIRPLGDVIVLMPALAMAVDDLERLVAITAEAITRVTAGRLQHAA
jgi:adenosylmethionine-8-amino-7-oxononanoate aminotransferase